MSGLAGGAGTIGALIFARKTVLAAWRQVEHSAEQQQKRQQEYARTQASKVAAWMKYEQNGDSRKHLYLYLVNASETPVYRVMVRPCAPIAHVFFFPVLEPTHGNTKRIELAETTEWIHKEGSRIRSAYPSYAPSCSAEQLANMLGFAIYCYGVTVRFSDSHGTAWNRTKEGTLDKLDETPDTYANSFNSAFDLQTFQILPYAAPDNKVSMYFFDC